MSGVFLGGVVVFSKKKKKPATILTYRGKKASRDFLGFRCRKLLKAHHQVQVLTAAAVGRQPATSNSLNEL